MSYISALRTHTLVIEHKKANPSPDPAPVTSFKVFGHNDVPINYNEVYLRNVRLAGNNSALPAVVYTRISLAQTQTYLSLSVERVPTLPLRDSIFPFYPSTVNDQERLIAHGENASKIMNATISFVTFDSTGIMTPFTDYTSAVVELVLR